MYIYIGFFKNHKTIKKGDVVMSNTYSQLYIHFVFAVQNRLSLIKDNWQNDLYKYINGIVENHGHKQFAINGMPDHIHIFVSMNPKQSPSELMFEVKRSSTIWINNHRLIRGKLSWQEGFGAFSYGKSQVNDVCRYIENQQTHHQKSTFHDEYMALLKAFDIEYNERYIFKPLE